MWCLWIAPDYWTFIIWCRYVKPLWDVIEKLIGARISFKKILGLDTLFREDSVLSVISFLIYKGWLVLSLENKQRNANICLAYFKNELSVRIEIYNMCKCIDMEHIDKLSAIVLQLQFSYFIYWFEITTCVECGTLVYNPHILLFCLRLYSCIFVLRFCLKSLISYV